MLWGDVGELVVKLYNSHMNVQTAIVLKSTTVYCVRDTGCMCTFKSLRPVFGNVLSIVNVYSVSCLLGDDFGEKTVRIERL